MSVFGPNYSYMIEVIESTQRGELSPTQLRDIILDLENRLNSDHFSKLLKKRIDQSLKLLKDKSPH